MRPRRAIYQQTQQFWAPELLAIIRSYGLLLHLPVIVMTSSTSPAGFGRVPKAYGYGLCFQACFAFKFYQAILDIFHLPSETVRPLEAVGLVE
jgi:hypothetical protein